MVQLSAPTNATLADAQAIVTIQDDDGATRRYLAEGRHQRVLRQPHSPLLNPSATAAATVTLRFLRSDGVTVTHGLSVPPLGPAHGRPQDHGRDWSRPSSRPSSNPTSRSSPTAP